MKHHDHSSHNHQHSGLNPYTGLALMTFLHFLFMYGMNFLMVDAASSIFMNINALYMTLWMVAPSVVIMIILMKEMYPKKKLNVALSLASVLIFVLSFVFIRQQTLVGDKQFIRSMIPHHSGAILMCQEGKIEDAELKALCADIIKAQHNEIEQMKTILERL
ncbi:MAG: DUF305 domain-containing protein [Bdellovibrionaceae bacterium]|nr:DUF305 domain-containing protein [Pseudobdellovibrionaceae bacterium]